MYNKRLYIGIDVGDKGGCSFFFILEKNPVYYIDFRKLGTIKNFKKKLIPFIENYNDIYACIEPGARRLEEDAWPTWQPWRNPWELNLKTNRAWRRASSTVLI